GEDLGDVAQGGVPVGRAEVAVAAEAQLRPGEAVLGGDGRAELGAPGADGPEGGRNRLDAPGLEHLPRPRRPHALQAEAAADAAVRANGFAEYLQAVPLPTGAARTVSGGAAGALAIATTRSANPGREELASPHRDDGQGERPVKVSTPRRQ